MKYPGLAYIGSGKMTGLYGLNETIHDQKSIGLQHLYIDDYQTDFIYSATSVVKLDDKCYYGDRIKPRSGHPIKRESDKTYCKEGFSFVDEFYYDRFKKTDSVYCMDDYHFVFNCEVTNTSDDVLEVEVACLVITTANDFSLSKSGDNVSISTRGKTLFISSKETDMTCRVSKDAPSGFMYHGIQDILFGENEFIGSKISSNEPLAVSLSKKILLHPNESYNFSWSISTKDHKINYDKSFIAAKDYWSKWLSESESSVEKEIINNLIAIKAINMKGFIPADLTGHYFASDDVCFYVRDALHGARAFLYSGHYKECKEIVDVVSKLSRRDNHEIFQRYNSKLLPDEGANNNVFSQIDFIGYLLRLVADYYHLTGELLIDTDELLREVMILDDIPSKKGLYGPEGGVNEGVYGPAYITSTNIFIAGGLMGLIEILEKLHKEESLDYILRKVDKLIEGINGTFLEDNYYGYGYVDYHDQLVKRYDTPQLFGASLGYPVDENYRKSFYTLTDIATYHGYGYGYSEQEYHDGPWVFNTSFAAQTAYILGDKALYDHIINWLNDHKNKYGLLPEAIDARDEERSFINPLMWANAEYICAKYSNVIAHLRNGGSH
ncbi:hypothetical protein EZV73_27415 [Acidaminobacter sp. JC074]|uniref:hypothetical protein n=1 Tax=Acidaminobacter sp. JC074 TaxID=2530199 RepID=UPI001F0E2F1C|nr:hypothetical protein [Acidaminobacter sp. JC074]MCH4891330.1 hypothetical protein [Acidaminobacter sp. JC074]